MYSLMYIFRGLPPGVKRWRCCRSVVQPSMYSLMYSFGATSGLLPRRPGRGTWYGVGPGYAWRPARVARPEYPTPTGVPTGVTYLIRGLDQGGGRGVQRCFLHHLRDAAGRVDALAPPRHIQINPPRLVRRPYRGRWQAGRRTMLTMFAM